MSDGGMCEVDAAAPLRDAISVAFFECRGLLPLDGEESAWAVRGV